MTESSNSTSAPARAGALEKKFREWCEAADIRILVDGENFAAPRPWDVVVHDGRLFGRILSHGTLGLGEAYMDGWWDCDRMDEMLFRAIRSGMERHISNNLSGWLHEAAFRLLNLQSRSRAFMVAKHHYDADPALFRAMLDPFMQ